jgi:hypothetical protein
MKFLPQDSSQTAQRVRVGLTGLALVLLLIGLASVILNAARGEPRVTATGGANSAAVANLTDGVLDNGTPNEPLAELGVAPSTETNTAEPR